MRPFAATAGPALLVASLLALTGCGRTADAPAAKAATTAPPAALAAPAEASPPEGVLLAYVWECEDERRLNMKNLFRENAITLEMHEGPRKLPQVVAASGAKYSDGSHTFWTRGGSATWEHQGITVECRELRFESLLADARERGLRYRGTGNEPGWLVEIGPGERIEFVTAFGQERHSFDNATESAGDRNARVFTATHGDQPIQVTVSAEACIDDMSGAAFDHVVRVEFGGQSHRGCGTALQ
jgi:putative lipoprotein